MSRKTKPAIELPKSENTIKNCTFYGVRWDAKSIATVQTVAEGLVENAKALGQLASLFHAQDRLHDQDRGGRRDES